MLLAVRARPDLLPTLVHTIQNSTDISCQRALLAFFHVTEELVAHRLRPDRLLFQEVRHAALPPLARA